MRTHFSTAAAVLLAATIVSSPRIIGVTPTAVATSPNPQLLTVAGEGFMAGLSLAIATPGGGSQVFRGADIQSRSDSSFQVAMTLASAGTYSLVVTNPDGGASAAFPLSVTAARSATAADPPVIDTVTPAKTTARQDPQTLRVDGKRFVSGLTVYVSDPIGQVVTLSSSDVMDMTPNGFRIQAVLGMEGQYTLNVTNPDGGLSNAFTVTATKLPAGGR